MSALRAYSLVQKRALPLRLARVPIYSLSVHADYRCRHSGVCCSTDWDIPVEVPIYHSLREALNSRRIRAEAPFLTVHAPPDGAAAILRRDKGTCVFFEHETRLCGVHRELGEAALPATCRLFPWISLRDRRGTFITLSHYCPTAAGMLFREDLPLSIVENPPAFPEGEYEGLNAHGAWSPLLHPAVLMDEEGYGAWEQHAVDVFASNLSPDAAIATLARDVELLRTWQPGSGSLATAIAQLPERSQASQRSTEIDESARLFETVVAAVPEELKPAPLESAVSSRYPDLVAKWLDEFGRPVNRYLAAHAFASWCSYQGHGLRSFMCSLETALAVLRVESTRVCARAGRPLDRDLLIEAVRAADLLLRHSADRQALADIWSRSET